MRLLEKCITVVVYFVYNFLSLCEKQGKKQTYERQLFPLLQTHLERWDTDNWEFILESLPHKNVETTLPVVEHN
jgi:hypothetical protein